MPDGNIESWSVTCPIVDAAGEEKGSSAVLVYLVSCKVFDGVFVPWITFDPDASVQFELGEEVMDVSVAEPYLEEILGWLQTRLEVGGHLMPRRRRRVPQGYEFAVQRLFSIFFERDRLDFRTHAFGIKGLKALLTELEKLKVDKFDSLPYDQRHFYYSIFNRVRDLQEDIRESMNVYKRARHSEKGVSEGLDRSKRVDAGLKTSPELRDLFDEAAEQHGLNRSDWMHRVLIRQLERQQLKAVHLLPPLSRGSHPDPESDLLFGSYDRR